MAGLYSAINQWSTQLSWWWLLSKQLMCLRVLSVCLCYQQGLHSVLVWWCFLLSKQWWMYTCLDLSLCLIWFAFKSAQKGGRNRNMFLSKTSFHNVNSAPGSNCRLWPIKKGVRWKVFFLTYYTWNPWLFLPHSRVMASSFPKRKRNCYVGNRGSKRAPTSTPYFVRLL